MEEYTINRFGKKGGKTAATNGNVDIDKCGDETVIRIRPLFRIGRLLAIPPIMAITYFWMVLISFAVLASSLESWGTEGPYWFEFCLFLAFGIVGHYFAAMLLAVSFSKEMLILSGRNLRYRFSMFGIGLTRKYPIDEISIQIIPESIIGHNPITRFFGLSKPRFQICRGRKSKTVCGDVTGAGASKIADALQSRNLIG